ncbi:hypothetical protein ACF0H5_004023 [Mactra antiquata]
MDYRLTLLLAFLVGAIAVPTRRPSLDSVPTSCSTICTAGTKFNYNVGTTYRYKYEEETITSMHGASEDHSTIGINALVDVEIISKCEMIMQVNDVSIFAYDSKEFKDQDTDGIFAQTLSKYPMRFSFQDGNIVSICPHDQEQSWATNIKRGILSSFQNSMSNFDLDFKGYEKDVTGNCLTDYTVTSRGWKSISIKKSKDISTCSHRQGFDKALQTTPFRLSSGMKSLPILKSTHTCDQEVSVKGYLVSSSCHEVHLLRPFSKENSGASTEVTQKLTFVFTESGTNNINAETGAVEELYFQHSLSETDTDLSARDAINILQGMCDDTGVTPLTSKQFSSLVSTMKRIDFSGLQRVYNQVLLDRFCKGSNERVRKFYIDAIPMVGTEAAVELMKTLVSNGEIVGSQADLWLTSMAFIDHPTTQMIQYVQELIGLPSLSTKVLLPLSSMIKSYCQTNPSCGDVSEVQDFINILKTNLDGGCRVTQNNFRNVMMTLRSIGNIGSAETLIPDLYNCITESDNSMDIKVAAIQAFRGMSCAADRNNLLGIYRDSTADSEIRIVSYLAVIQCPTDYIVSQILETLETEEVNQVGSFVWSHLTNLQESSDPSNSVIQDLLRDYVANNDFDLERFKYSRNYEGSFFLEKYNLGAKADSNIIWSTESFVPRMATLNLTTHLFGESMNLFEVGGRIEGLDTLLESYFGPVGYYNDKDRDNNDIPEADPQLAKLSKKKFSELKKEAKSPMDLLRGAIYMRTFGNEISYNMFGANNGISDSMSEFDVYNFLQKLRNNEEQETVFTKNVMFLDTSYTIPTVVGLPLKLSINGTASVSMNVGGQVDIKNPKSRVVIEGNFEPSGSVEVNSMMSIDAMVTRGGLKMVSTLYTSTGAHGQIELMDGAIFDLTFDITKEKSDILDVKSSFFIVYNEFEKEQRMNKNGRVEDTVCSGDRLKEATGLQFCVGYSGPKDVENSEAPYFPLSGPVSFSMAMHKLDMPNGYQMQVKTIENDMLTLFRFISDTPGSTDDRAVGLDVQVTHPDKLLEVTLTSPWTLISLNGQLTNTANEKGLTGFIDVDKKSKLYTLDSKILIDKIKDRITYTPQISISMSDWKNLKLTGLLNYVKEKSLDADLNIDGLTEEPVIVKGSILNTDIMVGVKGKVNYQPGDGYEFEAVSKRVIEKKKLRTRYIIEPRLYLRTPSEELIEFDVSTTIVTGKSFKAQGSLKKITKIPFIFNVDLSKTEITKKKRVKATAKVNLTGPKLSIKSNAIYDNRASKNVVLRTRLEYRINKTWKDTLFTLTTVKTTFYKHKKIVKISSSLNSVENDNLDAALSVNYFNAKLSTRVDANFKYGQNLKQKGTKETVQLKLFAKHPNEKTTEYTVNLNHPASDLKVDITGVNTIKEESAKIDFQVQYHPERSVTFDIFLHNKTDLYPNYAGSIAIKLPQSREVSFAGGFGKENDNKYVSNLEFEIIKGRRTRIDTVLKLAQDKLYEFEVGVQVPEVEPLRVIGAYTQEENSHSIEASYSKGDKIYRIYGQSIYEEEKTMKFIFDVAIPSRRVKILTGYTKMNTEKHISLDIQWNADINLEDRFLTNITYDFKGWNDFEIGSSLYYPTRQIDFNMKHSAAARYLTNIELSWSPKDKMEFNIIFRDDVYIDADRTELSVEFSSPFDGIEKLGLGVSLMRDASQYQTKSSVTWGKKQKILVSATAKVPLTVESVDLVGTLSTPFDEYKTMMARVKHRFNDGLSSEISVQWGRKKLSLTSAGQFKRVGLTRSFTGSFDIRTPFDEFRVLIVKASHHDDTRQYNTKLSVETTELSEQKTAVMYSVEMGITHDDNLNGFSNTGQIDVVMPNDLILTTWELSNAVDKNRAMFTVIPQRGNTFKVDFTETHQVIPFRKISSSFELMIPTEDLKEVLITLEHEDKPGIVGTTFQITKDKVEVMHADINYKNKYRSLKFDSLLRTAYTEDLKITLVSAHSIMPYTGQFIMNWGDTPYKVEAESSVYYNEFGLIDSSLKITSPIPGMNYIKIISKREKKGLNWETENSIVFDNQRVSVETIYRIDHVKLTTLNIKTSFPQFPGLTTSFRVDGTSTNFNGDASFEMKPYVNQISSDFNLAYYPGTSLKGAFNLNTPFRQYPYMKMKFDSNKMGISRVSNFELEYLPTQIFKLNSDYRFTSFETLEGSVRITSPYTKNEEVLTTFTHIGNMEEFKTKAKITCDCFRKPVFADGSFSSKNGIQSTFEMESPFRGYETVKWNFNHRGQPDDFYTKAEYETSGKKITFENLFQMKDAIKYQITFLTPFADITRTHLEFSHSGTFPNTNTKSEISYNENTIKSDFTLKHNKRYTEANVVMNTPFNRYEDITMLITKSGSMNDFKADADLVFDQHWHGTLQHSIKDWKISTMAVLTSPLLKHDAELSFIHDGEPMNFESTIVYTLGPEYTTTSKAKFHYELPNLLASSETTTEIEDEVRVNSFSVENKFDYQSSTDFQLTTKVYGQVREDKANADLIVKYIPKDEVKFSFVSNLPIETYSHTEILVQAGTTDMKQRPVVVKMQAVAEIPTFERFEYKGERAVGDDVAKVQEEISYGDLKFTKTEMWRPGTYLYKVTTPVEGYENTLIEVKYGGTLFNYRELQDNIDWVIDANYEASMIERPILMHVKGSMDIPKVAIDNDFTLTYDDNKIISVNLDRSSRYCKLKITTPYKPYESIEYNSAYTEKRYGFDLKSSVKSSALQNPVNLDMQYVLNSNDILKMTVEFNGYGNYKLDTEASTKDVHLELSWNDDDGTPQKILVNGPALMYNTDAQGMSASISMSIATPFKPIEDFILKCEHQHFTSPLKAKEAILIQYNNKKYLDLNSEFGALSKFSGIISIQQPRQMEFSLICTNEAESVDADLLINWDKLDQDSSFRLQFGVADSGNTMEVKKVVFVRAVNPGRIISIHNNFTQSKSNIQSSGKISWDESNNEEMTYDFDFTVKRFTYSSNLKINVPVRSVEASGEFTNKNSELSAAGSLLWDAKKDANKKVDIKLMFDPSKPRKIATAELSIPSLNKQLKLSNAMAVNDGVHLIDGQTVFTYAPERTKAVVLKYTIQDETKDKSVDDQSYSAGWSLYHDYTNTHIMMSSDLTIADTVNNANLQLKYQSAKKEITALDVRSVLDLNERSYTIKILGEPDSAMVKGEVTSLSPYSLTISTFRNMKPTWKTTWTVDTDSKSLDARMTYDNMKKQIVTEAMFLNSTSFISTTTTSNGDKEGMVSAELVDRKLHGHIIWRPEIISESAHYASDVIQHVLEEMSPVMEKCLKGLGEEMVKKHNLIQDSLQEELSPLSDDLKETLASVEQDLKKMRREMKKLYKDNAFYMKTIEDYSDVAIKSMITGYSVTIERMRAAHSNVEEKLQELTNKLEKYNFKENYDKMVKIVNSKVKEIEDIVVKELEMLLTSIDKKFTDISEMYNEAITEVSEHLQKILEVLLEEFALTPYLEDVQKALNNLAGSGIDQAEIKKLLEQVREVFVKVAKESKLVDKALTVYKMTSELINKQFGDEINLELLREMEEALNDLHKQVSWLYKTTKMDVSVKELVQNLHYYLRQKIMEEFNELPIGLLDLHKSKVITFDLDKGEVEFDLYLPMPMKDFNALMKMSVMKHIEKLKLKFDKYFPRRDICVQDFFYNLPPVQLATKPDITPPFDVFGIVSGKQHFTTFDGHHYDIAGLCSYVLTQDMVDGNFSVTLKYQGGPHTLQKESIVVMVAGQTVELFQDYMVKVNNKPAELPYRAYKIEIIRLGDKVILTSDFGVSVVSDFSRDYHIVGLSGWYFGKVGGLLGSYDNERYNDIMTSAGEVTDNIRKFSRSWEVDRTCRSTMVYIDEDSTEKKPECENTFSASSSSLRPCFLFVEPDSYERMCNMESDTLCNIAHLYVTTCAKQGITVSLPTSCVQCPSHNANEVFTSDETLRYEDGTDNPVINSMDVVFVVEDRQCNEAMSPNLKDVVYELEQALSKSGVSGNRYSLVGYAGSMIDSHTMEGRLFNEATKFTMGLENVHFNSIGPYSDPIAAMEYASSLPFRTGVKKVMILVSCSACAETKGLEYSTLSEELTQKDITLHVFRQNAFHLTDNSSPNFHIYGIDNTNRYLQKDSNIKYSDIVMPSDHCTSLALDTKGSIFNSGYMLVDKLRDRKQFMNQFNDRVTQKPSTCQVCNCEINDEGVPQTVCRACDSQPIQFKPIDDAMKTVKEYNNVITGYFSKLF